MSSRKKKRSRTTAARQPAGTSPTKQSDAIVDSDALSDAGDVPAGGAAAVAASGVTVAGAGDKTAAVPLRWVRLVLVGLAFVGFLISFYLTLTHYRDIVPPCYGTSGCEEVITSRYAVILGIPLSLVGTLYFTIMFYLGIALLTVSGRRRLLLRAYGLLADLGVLAALVLFLLQALILKAYCTYCLTTEVITLLIWGGSWWVMQRETAGQGAD